MRVLSLSVLLLVGCVPKKDHLGAMAAQEAALSEQIDACGAENDKLAIALQAERNSNAELTALAAELQAGNAALQGELSSMSTALSDLSARGRQSQSQKAELEAQLSRLQQRSAATEVAAAAAQDRIAALKAEATRLAAEKEALEQKTEEYGALVAGLKAEIDSGQITISELSGKLTVQVSNALLFDSGSTTLKAEGQAALGKVAGVLQSVADREIRVEGHTDNVPVRAGAAFADNWTLSALRAREVVVLLTAQGVSPTRVAVVGYGDQRPVASNDTAEGRAANRRTEIVLAPRLEQR
ncbi:MAG: chemotaxis protein MotB [Myxococcota bacterium]|jgi:chemotaxis protein MotB